MITQIRAGMEVRHEPMYDAESFAAFAERFGLTIEELFTLNSDKRPPKDRIYFGQHLYVPLQAKEQS